jgi:hypothetical protein
MDYKFDELAKGLAQSVTRRQAFKRFGVGLAATALACFGVTTNAAECTCTTDADCNGGLHCSNGYCVPKTCDLTSDPCCCELEGKKCVTGLPKCHPDYGNCVRACVSGWVC